MVIFIVILVKVLATYVGTAMQIYEGVGAGQLAKAILIFEILCMCKEKFNLHEETAKLK